MTFAVGENVGPYRIIEQLGQGGMATVHKAYHAALDRYVAIKVLHPAFLQDPNFLKRFQREAKAVARLDHPNIVPVYDFAEHAGQPYLVMKYIEGDTLKARLRSGRLSKEEGLHIVEAAAATPDTPCPITHDHIYKPLPIPSRINPRVPAEVERVLLKSLAKERADRYP